MIFPILLTHTNREKAAPRTACSNAPPANAGLGLDSGQRSVPSISKYSIFGGNLYSVAYERIQAFWEDGRTPPQQSQRP